MKKNLRKPVKKTKGTKVMLYGMEGGTNYGNCNCIAGC